MSSLSVVSTSVPSSVVDVLYQSLERALVAQCRQRYDADVTVRRLDDSSDESGARLRIECRGLLRVSGRLVVIPSGKQTYEVFCSVEGTASRRLTYSQPGKWGTTLSHAPVLGRELATFVRDELEKRLGRRLLRGPAGRSSSVRTVLSERDEP